MCKTTVGQVVLLVGLSCLAIPVYSQGVLIKGATPAAVTDALADYLKPDGWVVTGRDSTQAVFGLDRGMVPQHGMYHGRTKNNLFRVVMELHSRYKPKPQGLEVNLYEDAVVLESDSALVERRRVTTRSELDNLLQVLQDLRLKLESRTSSDTTH